MKRLVTLLVIILGLLTCSAAQTRKFHFTPTPDDVVWSRLERYEGKNRDREQTLRTMFTEAGCKPEQLAELPVKHTPAPNVACTIPGESGRVIIIGAHFDYVDRGKGVVDNWSGASMLPSLLETIAKEPRRHTYMLIGFTDEEKGLIGSADYVHRLSEEQRAKIAGMVNLDTIGLGTTEVWMTHAAPELAQPLADIAKAMNLPVYQMNVERVGSSDSESFRERKIPSMTIHSITQKTLGILHTPKDTIDQISRKDYLESYRLIAGYLVYLDDYLDAPGTISPATK
jgi:Zn-dependent M28 family amino/carboxypeptidase